MNTQAQLTKLFICSLIITLNTPVAASAPNRCTPRVTCGDCCIATSLTATVTCLPAALIAGLGNSSATYIWLAGGAGAFCCFCGGGLCIASHCKSSDNPIAPPPPAAVAAAPPGYVILAAAPAPLSPSMSVYPRPPGGPSPSAAVAQ